MYDYILFDLDGTLINSEQGIKESLRFAFDAIGINYEGDVKKFIGPSFKTSFPLYLGVDADVTEALIAAYRKHYAQIGVFECKLYNGIRDLLVSLHGKGKKLILATSKPLRFAKIILKQKRISSLFNYICGAEGQIVEKEDVLKKILSSTGADSSNSVLVGDTIYDCKGAKAVGLDCIFVTYGYGTADLVDFPPKAVVDSPYELKKLLLSI